MSQINGIGGNGPVQRVAGASSATNRAAAPAAQAERGRPADRLELSGVSHLLSALKGSKDVRLDKVAQVRAELDAGTYETDARIDAAVDRLLDEIARQQIG